MTYAMFDCSCTIGTMPRYVFTYFNIRAKGEVARMLFAYSGLKYEDVRPTDDEWRALKPSKWATLTNKTVYLGPN